MSANRLLTTAVQLALAIPALVMGRMMWEMLKEDVRELAKDFRLTKSSWPAKAAASGVSLRHCYKKP